MLCANSPPRWASATVRTAQGGFDHAAVISLIDEKGEIVFQQRGTQASSDELLAKLKTLLAARM